MNPKTKEDFDLLYSHLESKLIEMCAWKYDEENNVLSVEACLDFHISWLHLR